MKKILLILLVSLLYTSVIFSQTSINQLTDNLTESIILETDRELYLNGENIWFKAHAHVSTNSPGKQLSNVLYIELFDLSKQSYVRKKFKIKNQSVSGMFQIPGELNSGNYLIRAYTQYQRNGNPEFFATKPITIINPSLNIPEQNESSSKIKIQSEFGYLVTEIKNKLAINLGFGHRQKPSEIWIKSNKNIEVFRGEINDGFGLIEFIPLASNTYTLHTIINTDTIEVEMPPLISEGIFMQNSETQHNDQLVLKIINLQTSIKKAKLELFTKHLNKIMSKEISLNEVENNVLISNSKLNEGFNYFVLRDDVNKIINIHSYYKFPDAPQKITIVPNKELYEPRAKIELDISAPTNNTDQLDLILKVVKKGTSLYGNIGIPEYLIQNPILLDSYVNLYPYKNLSVMPQLETLLISNNSEIAINSDLKSELNRIGYDFKWIPEIRDVSVSGYVRDKTTQEAVANTEVYASVFKDNPQVHTYKTDQNGFFIFSLNNLTETQNVFISINDKTDESANLELLINNDFAREYPSLNTYPFSIKNEQIPFIEELFINTQASKVFKTETGTNQIPSIKLPYSFANPEFSINLDDYVESKSLEVVFRELIPSVKVKLDEGKFRLSVTDPLRRIAQKEPLIMVDYITIFNVDELMKINPSKIQKIDIYTTPYVLGNSQFDGVILITTKTDDFGAMKMPAESVFFEYSTISETYEFSSPTYDNKEILENRKADFRNLLYWNPNLKLKNHKRISFYASDHCSEYEIIISGISKEGQRYYGKHQIEIKK